MAGGPDRLIMMLKAAAILMPPQLRLELCDRLSAWVDEQRREALADMGYAPTEPAPPVVRCTVLGPGGPTRR